ncbi:MAG: serine/threonine-protein kinase [Anaerolineales bacterium]|nr:serine/threonine-protein kinase [Anaerolineales bacterium]
MNSLIGKNIGRYKILSQLGKGGMAVVYEALDTTLDRRVAIKFIQPGKEQIDVFLARFRREAKALAKLSHPNIVKIFDSGEFEGNPYLVMDYIQGGTLKDLMKDKPLSWQKSVQITIQMARALDAAHKADVLHRDIKPSNILMANDRTPMLSDFGIAKIIGDDGETVTTLTDTGAGIGTPDYMAPEQGVGKADERSDIYALGVALYQLVTGRLPYHADTPLAVMLKKSTEPLPPPSTYVKGLPSQLEQVLVKALASNPSKRFKSMGEFESALERLGGGADTLGTFVDPVTDADATYDQFETKTGTIHTKPFLIFPVAVGAGVLILCVGILGLAFLANRILFTPTSERENPTDSAPLPPSVQEDTPAPNSPTDGASASPESENPTDSAPSPTAGLLPGEEPASTIPERNFPIQIAYVIGTSGGNASIYVADANGGGKDLLTNNNCDNSVPHWSPDGTSIVFQSDCDGTYDIWQMSASGGSPFMLIGSQGYDDREAHYSLSGDQIVYVRHELGVSYNTNGDIRVYSDGSDKSTGVSGRGPVFSPDGSQLAYMHLDGGTWQIYVYDFNSGENSQITFGGDDSRWPAWSPDGREIAYNSATGQGSNPTGIWTISADGGDPQLVIEGDYGRPSWSESNLILFNSPLGLWVARPNGGGLEQITSDYGWAGSWSR